VEVRTHWKVVDMSCVSAEVQEETWDRYRVLEPLLEEYGDGRVPEERIADRIREYVEEQERRLVRGERTGRVFGGHGKAGEKEEKAGLVCVRSVQRWMRMFARERPRYSEFGAGICEAWETRDEAVEGGGRGLADGGGTGVCTQRESACDACQRRR
jgi:hypothetical protein